MDFGAIVGVIIGMVLVYSLLSIIVTQVNSLISIMLKTRASHLRDGIAELVSDPEIQAQVLRHPLLNIVTDERQNLIIRVIGALTGRRRVNNAVQAAQSQAAAQAVAAGQSPGPLMSPQLSGVTSLDPGLFTDALIDTLINNARDRFYAPLELAIRPLPEGAEKAKIKEKISAYKVGAITAAELNIDASCLTVKEACEGLKSAIDLIEPKRTAFEHDVRARDLENVLKGVSQISDPTTRRALNTLLASAQSVQDAEQKIGQWFDARMAQVSDRFKRHMQFYTLLIGFIIAAVLNVDTVHLANALYTQPVVRDSVSQIASAFVAQQQSAGTAQAATNMSENIDVVAAQAAQAASQVANLNLPLGWEFHDVDCAAIVGVDPNTVVVSTSTPSPTDTPMPTPTDTPPDTPADAAQGGDTGIPATLDPFTTPTADVIAFSAQDVPAAEPTAEATQEPAASGNASAVSNVSITQAPCNDRRNLALFIPFTRAFNFGNLFLKVIGLLLTTFAVGQGAPFWFDLLNRIVGRGGSSSAPSVNVTSPPVNVTVNPTSNGSDGSGAPLG
ncbi:MAG: hypothetical protein U0670_21645 [Anaerolineae bacterium]